MSKASVHCHGFEDMKPETQQAIGRMVSLVDREYTCQGCYGRTICSLLSAGPQCPRYNGTQQSPPLSTLKGD